MNVIKPSAELLTPIDSEWVLRHLERAGRLCYKSEDKSDGTVVGSSKFLKDKITRGHESIIEHFSASVLFVCDRGVSHEIVRHRLASYSQESTRYCNYSKERFGREITVIEPCFADRWTPEQYKIWYNAMEAAERHYMHLLDTGVTPQEARAVLPNSLKTEIIMTANIREWRHFFKVRCAPEAHPQMREVANMALKLFREALPSLFEDINYD